VEHVLSERQVKCQGHRPSRWIRAIIAQRISVMTPTAVILPVGLKNLEDCCIHHEEAHVRALRSGGRESLS